MIYFYCYILLITVVK